MKLAWVRKPGCNRDRHQPQRIEERKPWMDGPEWTDRKSISPKLANIRKAKKGLQVKIGVVVGLGEHPTEAAAIQFLEQHVMLPAHGEHIAAICRIDHGVDLKPEFELLTA